MNTRKKIAKLKGQRRELAALGKKAIKRGDNIGYAIAVAEIRRLTIKQEELKEQGEAR